MPTPEEILQTHDKEKRLKAEEDILAKAQALTNGSRGDAQLTGEVLAWVVQELIEFGVLLRVAATQITLCQLKEDCVFHHQNKKWVVRLFGATYSLPASVAIVVIGGLAFMACRKQGWM